ncbi:MAG: TonB-dependent receptor plug domain-containing protein [Gemmatimonadota bacterium]
MAVAQKVGASLKSIHAVLLVAAITACSGNPAPASASKDNDVSVGYGTQDAREVSGSVASLSGDVAERTHATSIEELIRGRVAGVQVLRKANGEFSIRIRGAGSFMGSGEPLFVIDGMPLPEEGASTAIASIAPVDVVRIDVLKDAGATAIYGVRGANGVIVITTRRSN